MHTMREQLMVRMSAVFIYLNGVSLFVKDCRQVTYGALTFITFFFFLSNQERRNHPFKIYNVDFLFLTTVDYK